MNAKEKAMEIINNCEEDVLWEIYRHVRKENIKEDVFAWCSDNKMYISEEDAYKAADVFDKVHDCELSYWDNIRACIMYATEITDVPQIDVRFMDRDAYVTEDEVFVDCIAVEGSWLRWRARDQHPELDPSDCFHAEMRDGKLAKLYVDLYNYDGDVVVSDANIKLTEDDEKDLTFVLKKMIRDNKFF